jgi:hypothetical protein
MCLCGQCLKYQPALRFVGGDVEQLSITLNVLLTEEPFHGTTHVVRMTPKLKKAAPTSGSVEAACCRVVELFLLLALVVSLRRMLVSCFGFLNGLS